MVYNIMLGNVSTFLHLLLSERIFSCGLFSSCLLPMRGTTTVNINFPTDTSSLLGTHKITLSACLCPPSRVLVSIPITLDYAAEIVITLRCDLHFKSHDESFESIACSSRHLLWLSIGLILLPFLLPSLAPPLSIAIFHLISDCLETAKLIKISQ